WRGSIENHGEPERAAVADLAGDADLAVHQLGETLGDGEPKARSPCLPSRRGVDLGEGSEETIESICGNACAGVADREAENRRLLVFSISSDVKLNCAAL